MHGFGPDESRLSKLKESVGWTALSTDESPWIMADLGKLMPIYQVRTLGNLAGNAWVTSYMICKISKASIFNDKIILFKSFSVKPFASTL